MESGLFIFGVLWIGSFEDEFDVFVFEQFYIYIKVFIVDDQLVICGFVNFNDCFQFGDYDFEIVVIIEDLMLIRIYMNGCLYIVFQFVIFFCCFFYCKYFGFVFYQYFDCFDINWMFVIYDVVNYYDWDFFLDCFVVDFFLFDFINLWCGIVCCNIEIFSRVFYFVFNDKVRIWEDYDNFFFKYFVIFGELVEQVEEGYKNGKVDYGYVVRENFFGGVGELKMWFSGIRGNFVEMLFNFLIDVFDIVEDGLVLNSLMDEFYI